MKIALAQINTTVGDFEGNYRKILSCINKARKKNSDIVVFPELALCGYPPEDLLFKPSFLETNTFWIKKLQEVIDEPVCIIGYAHRSSEGLYNAAGLFHDHAVVDVYHKIELPNYSVFDEKRYFLAGTNFVVYTIQGKNIAVSICEDIWTDSILNGLQGKKIDVVLNISASPFHLGKLKNRIEVLSRKAKLLQCALVYCNSVGAQDELVFDGNSMVFDAHGDLVQKARSFQEDLLTYDLEKKYSPLRIDRDDTGDVYAALIVGLQDYVRKNGFTKIVLGVSGGIDSAVTAALAQGSLGKENVVGLIMPSRYTSSATYDDAITICKNLGIEHHVIRIEDVFSSYLKTLEPFFKNAKPDITEENLQARVRGNLLMAFSNKYGYLVLNTGNKSELSVGYCTLYGDMVGGFGLLKDVTKELVYKLAEYINRKGAKKVIPEPVIQRPPSAELRHNQKDEDSIPPYSILDPVIRLYIEKEYSYDQIVHEGYDRDIVKKIITLIDKNEYKRRQGPPGIKITPKAFGKDRRMPITNRFIL